MIEQMFKMCVLFLHSLAAMLGTTYQAVNVWIFLVIWPMLTLFLLGVIMWQRRLLRRRDEQDEAGKM